MVFLLQFLFCFVHSVSVAVFSCGIVLCNLIGCIVSALFCDLWPSLNITIHINEVGDLPNDHNWVISSPEQKVPVSYFTTHGVSVHKC